MKKGACLVLITFEDRIYMFVNCSAYYLTKWKSRFLHKFVWCELNELDVALSRLQCPFASTAENGEGHFVKEFCAESCLNTLLGLEGGEEKGFRCHGHAVTMVTPHSTFLQPLVNKRAFEEVFIWTKKKKRKQGTPCKYEFSLDRSSGLRKFTQRARQRHNLPNELNLFSSSRQRLPVKARLLKCCLLSPSQLGVQPFLPSHGDPSSAQPPPDRHPPSRHRLTSHKART